ncbi:hypothetical protein DFH09DRAFT_1334565 [Mycena vulgaris]|nr:hypothetical protein DFH09DRAFT_1334565 [Mycena vulgaris]
MTSGGGYGNTQTGAGYGANNRADQFDGGASPGLQHSTHIDSGASNQDLDSFGTSGRTGGMDYNSGPGNTGGGFDAGSGAEGYGTSGNTGGNFGTSGMDQNSGAGNTGGGFDTGSGAGAGAALGRTGGNFGTSGMVQNSGPGNSGGGFDTGSGAAGVGAGTDGYGAGNTTSSSNEYGSGNQYSTGSSSNEYGDTSNNSGGKPSVGDKIKGGAEKLVGKVTKNPEMIGRGQQRKASALCVLFAFLSFVS